METKFFDSQRFIFYIVFQIVYQIRAYDIRILRSADSDSPKQTKPYKPSYQNMIDRRDKPANSRDEYNMEFARTRYSTMNSETIHRIDCTCLDRELEYVVHRGVTVIFNENTK